MSPRTISVAAALMIGVAVFALAPKDASQSGILRTSERWLEGQDFAATGDGELRSGAIEAPHEFESLGVSWRASGGSELSHRVSADGVHWSNWLPLPEDHHGSAAGKRSLGQLQFYPQPARFLQLRVRGDAPELDGMHAVFIQPGAVTSPPAPAPLDAASATNPVPQPPVVSRSDWACPDGQGSRWAPAGTEVDFLIVHHSAGSNSSSNWAATVQAIWSFHALTRGWGDVGYNFLIDPNGVIYEGRAGGENTIGAHFSCTNGGTMGVCLIGDFTGQEPTTAALDSLAHLLAWKADKESIDPFAQGFHTGSALVLDKISGHRDGNPGDQGCASGTVCPGAMLYPLLPGLRTQVANIIETGTPYPPELGIAGYDLTGEMRPGEAIDLAVTLEHLNGGPATGIRATLTTSSPYFDITDSTKNYPDLAGGASDDQIGDFDFTIAPGAPHGHQATIRLDVVADGGEWSFTIVLPPVVSPPVIDLAAVTFSPGESAPGATATVSYQIVADRAFGASFELTLIDIAAAEFPLPPFTTSLSAGSQTKNRGLSLPGDLPPGDYALRVRIAEGTSPVAEQTFAAALAILSPSFAEWAVVHISDPAQRGIAANPDGDRLTNLLEYALMRDPSQPDTAPLEWVWIHEAGARYPALSFVQRQSAGLSVAMDVRPRGGDWSDDAAIDVSTEALPGAVRRVVRSLTSAAESPGQLLRLRIDLEP